MHILGPGRGAFLEFLRNLTPTVLFISVALVLWSRLDFGRIDLSNWAVTSAFFVCSFTAVLSFYANISAFLDSAFGPILGFERAIRRLRRGGYSDVVLVQAVLLVALRRKPLIVIEAVIALVVIFAALQVGVVSALSTALTVLKNGVK